MIPAASAAPAFVFRKPGLRETTVLLVVAWLVPFAVHLLPWAGPRPLGAYLLPMFWTTFAAAYFYGPRGGVLTALFAPAVNLLLTGLPAWKFLSVMSFELVVFSLVAALLVRRWPRFLLTAPIAYLGARIGSLLLLLAAPVLGPVASPAAYVLNSLVGGLAGLVVLAAINAALVMHYSRGAARDDSAGV